MKKRKRYSFSKLKKTMDIPDLLEIQKESYKRFLQEDKSPTRRDSYGLEAAFSEIFPIVSVDGRLILEYLFYEIGKSDNSIQDCIEKDITYSVSLLVSLRLITKDQDGNIEKIIQDKIYMGELPYMTHRGTFIFNGAERAVVSQFHRSPGIFFEYKEDKDIFYGKIIPYHGSWMQFEIGSKNILIVRPDKKRKLEGTTFLRAIGISSTTDILKIFYKPKEVTVNDKILDSYLFGDVIYEDTGEFIGESGKPVTKLMLDQLKKAGVKTVNIIDTDDSDFSEIILNTLAKDETRDEVEALRRLVPLLRGSAKMPYEKAKEYVASTYFTQKKYDLSRTGRYKINEKFGEDFPLSDRCLKISDITNLMKYLIKLSEGKKDIYLDDIDHLGNRRVRSVGELIENEYKKGLSRLESTIKDRMTVSQETEDITPRTLINIKPVTAVIKEFFGSSQLSQFMDQTNPVAEVTHKRRLSALGPGGLSRERAGFEVRDVHHSHYGRVCPIETPEGPNIGLIVSLSNYAKVNELGFIETPYRVVTDGKVTQEIRYLNAKEEDKLFIAQANAPIDEKGKFTNDQISVRHKDNFLTVTPSQVQYMDVSPKQLVSATTSLIPFLEHDDANRALMGSNMQRQAVPLMNPRAPLVATGMESKIAKDSGITVLAEEPGRVCYVDSNEIWIESNRTSDDKDEKVIKKYNLLKFKKTNQCTAINQKPIVDLGQNVKKGEIIADGPATELGEVALGSDVLVAFMPWEGLNFEDAVLMSERVSKYDVYTSLHIERFEVYARETKLGKETITRDIPHLSEKALTDLDEDGIIRPGSKVESGDILVGKVTPKSTNESSPEQKLLQSIFGEKAKDVKDTSLKLEHGIEGIVIDVKVYSRENKDELPPGVEKAVKVYIATKRKIKEGDKIAGRHGNKGVISRIMPEEDMPFLEDGTPVDVVLNPLGVPSRMNIGQILETHLGWAADKLKTYFETPVFDGASADEIMDLMKKAGIPVSGQVPLFDGRTGEKFDSDVTVGQIYIMKLNHLVDEKIHARSIGPYSLVTQQPLGGKAQFGGQRLGEMEVWALEAYGAAYTLREMLTVKSDDIFERAKVYEATVKGLESIPSGIPESFNVLTHELKGLCLKIEVLDDKSENIDLKRFSEKRLEQFNMIMPEHMTLDELKALDETEQEESF